MPLTAAAAATFGLTPLVVRTEGLRAFRREAADFERRSDASRKAFGNIPSR